MTAESDIDVYVKDTFFKNSTSGVLVEVGAAGPDFLSISQRYRKAGWKVIAVEPNPAFCEQHRKLGYEVLEYAASDVEGDDIDFFVVDSEGYAYGGGELTFESCSSLGIHEKFKEQGGENLKTRTIPVKVRRLDTILATHAPEVEKIDLLVIDVEGWELHVLRGLNFERYRPTVIILENVFQDLAYEDAMIERGYERCKWLYPNEVYVGRTPALQAARIARRLTKPSVDLARKVLGPTVQRYRQFRAEMARKSEGR